MLTIEFTTKLILLEWTPPGQLERTVKLIDATATLRPVTALVETPLDMPEVDMEIFPGVCTTTAEINSEDVTTDADE
jgi:hypothetical protein